MLTWKVGVHGSYARPRTNTDENICDFFDRVRGNILSLNYLRKGFRLERDIFL